MDGFFPAAEDPAGRDEARRQVWKVSELTRRIKGTLEGAFGSVWVEGEISNFRKPASGHAYFTLKDATSQLRAVMFRSALAGVALPLKDGLLVRGYGQITVYEAAGDYQILLRKIEPAGEGELMLRLEALKKRLAAEGLFAAERKRPLPALPQHVGIVTSPTGAAIRDILQVLERRFANLHVVLAPVRVQGAGAADEIAAAIDLLNKRGGLDVLIVGRGGGSLEDLWCFNEETVVRAIVRSAIPVISAVGHEIDWTLSDFAADVRAPTPSAAAEMVVQGKAELERRVADLRRRLALGAKAATLGWRNRLDRAARTPGLRDPLQVVRQAQQSVDFLAVRLQKALAGLPQLVRQRAAAAARRMELAMRSRLVFERQQIERLTLFIRNRLSQAAPLHRNRMDMVCQRIRFATKSALRESNRQLDPLKARFENAVKTFSSNIRQRIASAMKFMEMSVRTQYEARTTALKHAEAQLRMLNPKGVLARGYSLTRLRDGRILKSVAAAPPGTELETELADGNVLSTVDIARRIT